MHFKTATTRKSKWKYVFHYESYVKEHMTKEVIEKRKQGTGIQIEHFTSFTLVHFNWMHLSCYSLYFSNEVRLFSSDIMNTSTLGISVSVIRISVYSSQFYLQIDSSSFDCFQRFNKRRLVHTTSSICDWRVPAASSVYTWQ